MDSLVGDCLYLIASFLKRRRDLLSFASSNRKNRISALKVLKRLPVSSRGGKFHYPFGFYGKHGFENICLTRPLPSPSSYDEKATWLVSLKELALDSADISTIPQLMGKATALKRLAIKSNSYPLVLPYLTQLEELEIHIQATFDGLINLGHLSGLKKLNISRSEVRGHDMCHFRNILDLDLSGIAFLNDANLDLLTGVKRLALSSTNIVGETLSGLTGLTSLDISKCFSYDLISNPISRLTGLLELNVSLLEFSYRHIEALTNLTNLNVNHCAYFYASSFSTFSNLLKISTQHTLSLQAPLGVSALRILDISDCCFNASDFKSLCGLRHLVDLKMDRSLQAATDGVSCFSVSLDVNISFPSTLQSLSLSDCHWLTEAVAARCLSGLTRLRLLNLSFIKINADFLLDQEDFGSLETLLCYSRDFIPILNKMSAEILRLRGVEVFVGIRTPESGCEM